MNNIILIFFNNLSNDSLNNHRLIQLIDQNNIIISLINKNSFNNIENIINSLKKYQDNIGVQMFFDSLSFDNYFNEYILYLKKYYNISNVFFIDNLDNLKKFINVLKDNNYELLVQYNESQFKLMKKQHI